MAVAGVGEALEGPIRRALETASGRTVRVAVPVNIAFNLDRMQGATKQILTLLGCGGCHSGWDIRFLMEQNFVVNEKGEVAGAGFGG